MKQKCSNVEKIIYIMSFSVYLSVCVVVVELLIIFVVRKESRKSDVKKEKTTTTTKKDYIAKNYDKKE